jgi:hypothetical protein
MHRFVAAVALAGCAGSTSPATPAGPARLAEIARASAWAHARPWFVGLPIPAGTATVCGLRLEIAPWYGADDTLWTVTQASTMLLVEPGIREELSRLGVRDCVLDVTTAR